MEENEREREKEGEKKREKKRERSDDRRGRRLIQAKEGLSIFGWQATVQVDLCW